MKTYLCTAFALFVLSAPATAQNRTPQTQTPPPAPDDRRAGPGDPDGDVGRPGIPLRVQIVLSRWDGDKKLSSQPYVLTVNANAAPRWNRPMGDLARLRMGGEVPVSGISGTQEMSKQTGVPAVAPIQYKAIGTNIDCMAAATQDGRYTLNITIEDSSVYADDHPQPGTLVSATTPVFRSFRLQNTTVLRDGQSTQFMTAADKIGGDLVKVDVTLNLVK